MRFTDIKAAIEEAEYLSDTTGRVHVITSSRGEAVAVVTGKEAKKRNLCVLETFRPCNRR